MIFRKKKTAEAIAKKVAFEVQAGAYMGLRQALYVAIYASRRCGRNPSIVLLGRRQQDVLQAELDEQWEAYVKAGDKWKENPPAASIANDMFFLGLRIVLVADADLLQVFEGTGEWK